MGMKGISDEGSVHNVARVQIPTLSLSIISTAWLELLYEYLPLRYVSQPHLRAKIKLDWPRCM